MTAPLFTEADVILSYSRADAIADGVRVDVTETAKGAGFVWPVALTASVFSLYVTPADELRPGGQSMTGRLWDLLTVLRFQAKRTSGRELLFTVAFVMPTPKGPRKQNVQLKSVAGPGDHGEPVLTVMLPDED